MPTIDKPTYISKLAILHDLLNKARLLAEEIGETLDDPAPEIDLEVAISFEYIADTIETVENDVFEVLQAERGA